MAAMEVLKCQRPWEIVAHPFDRLVKLALDLPRLGLQGLCLQRLALSWPRRSTLRFYRGVSGDETVDTP